MALQAASPKEVADIEIIPMIDEHAHDVLEIYRLGMETGIATAATEVPSWDKWKEGHFLNHCFVALIGARMAGWTALSPTEPEAGYRGYVRDSIYVHPKAHRRGVGTALLERLIVSATADPAMRVIEASIDKRNKGSIRLHEAKGFKTIGEREFAAFIGGTLATTVLMTRLVKSREYLDSLRAGEG